MNELTLANRASDWQRLKALVLDSVSSPITRRVYNLGLDEFIAWYSQEPRPGSVSINVRITAVRKLAVEAADNGLLAPELAAGITRVKGAKSTGGIRPVKLSITHKFDPGKEANFDVYKSG